jgi:hypothetical protein
MIAEEIVGGGSEKDKDLTQRAQRKERAQAEMPVPHEAEWRIR